MEFLRVRNIAIDVIPGSEAFIQVTVERVFTHPEDENMIVQTIGNYDRIVKKFSEIPYLPAGTIADDGYIDPMELYTLIAQVAYVWLSEKHGGVMQGERLVVG